MLDKILVLLDGSALAQCVLPHARTLAAAYAAEVTLLRVLDLKDREMEMQVDPVNWHLRKVEAQSYLNGLLHTWPSSGLPLHVALDEGTAVDRIVKYVEDNEPDLVILSTHGQSGLSSSNISSVAHKIIHLIPTSFMLVRARHLEEKANEIIQYKRILVPLDGSRRAECVLPFAHRLAAAQNAELALVHVVPQAEMIQRRPFSSEEAFMYEQLQERNKTEAIRYLQQLVEQENLSITTHLLTEAHVSDALIGFTESEQIDLVVMCAHGQSGGQNRLYGSLVTNFLHYSSAALLVIQDFPAEQIKLSKTNLSSLYVPGAFNPKIAYAQPEDWTPN